MENANPGDLVTCGKCGGNGLYFFSGGATGACYPCEGSGRVVYRAPSVARRRPKADFAQRLRTWYRNAQLTPDSPCHLTYSDVIDPDGCGWTAEGLSAALDSVPGSREAFRGLGWPV